MLPDAEGTGASPAADEFDVIDSLLSKADQDADGSEEADADETEGAGEDQDEDESPELDADDHPDAEDDEGQDDADEDGDEDDDLEEEGEGEGEEADLGAGKLSAKEMATINASPELKKAYRSMQAALTVKTQDLAVKVREVEAARGEVEADRGEVVQAKAILDDFIAKLEDTSEGGGREQALIGMALDDPALFQRAFDAVADMVEDPEKRKAYEKEQKRKSEDADRDRREQALAQNERKEFGRHANQLTKAAATRLKLDEAGQDLAAEFVADAIRASMVAGSGYRIKDEDIVAAVRRAERHVSRLRSGTRKEVEAEERVKRGVEVRKAAKNGRRRITPGAGRAPAPSAVSGSGRLKNAASATDPVSARVDELLSVV